MVWTVWYFLHQSNMWRASFLVPDADAASISPGAAAYAHRKFVMWRQLALIADQAFTLGNQDYQSPL